MNWWDQTKGYMANLFANRTVSGETQVIGVTIDDPAGDEDRFTEVDEEQRLIKYDQMRSLDSELVAIIRLSLIHI